MEESLKESKKKFSAAKLASLGFYLEHQNGSIEILAYTDLNDLSEGCLEFDPGYVGSVEVDDIPGVRLLFILFR
jgi:hypothetical protein